MPTGPATDLRQMGYHSHYQNTNEVGVFQGNHKSKCLLFVSWWRYYFKDKVLR